MAYHALDPNFCDSYLTLSNLNLTATNNHNYPDAHESVRGDQVLDPTKKIYCELHAVSVVGGGLHLGIATEDFVWGTDQLYWDGESWAYDPDWDEAYNNPASVAFGGSIEPANGDYVMMAVDLPNGNIWWGYNGTWRGASADPATGTNPAFTGQDFTTKDMYLGVSPVVPHTGGSATVTLATDPNDFLGTMPTGFEAAGTALPIYSASPPDTRHRQRADTLYRSTIAQTRPSRGAAALTLPAMGIAAYGAGQSALTLPMLQLAAVGAIGTAGAAALTLPMLQLAAAGRIPLTGAAALTLPMAAMAARALMGIGATGAASTPMMMMAGAGYQPPWGAAALTLPMARLSGQALTASRFTNYVLRHRR